MKKPIIIVDLDDTVNFFSKKWLNVVQEEHGINLAFDSIDKWNGVSHLLAAAKSWTFDQANEYCTSLFHRKDFFLDVEPDIMALQVLNELHFLGFELVIASKPPFDYSVKESYAVLDKMAWIKRHLPDIYDKIPVLFTADKQYVRGDVLIDDSTRNIEASDGIHTTIALNKPWNQDAYPDYRCNNWREVRDALKEMFPGLFVVREKLDFSKHSGKFDYQKHPV